ncbi:MAG: helix-turn-helix domain-containing protein, partial [Pseudomonadota bacterium]|nr:helix-turn-helix domain-containing protein [Pseudomonadota bacterium]
QKVCAVLRALASHAPAALRDLAKAAELNKVTTFRILGTLAREGFVGRPPGSQLYDLGPEVAVLARALASRVNLRAASRPALVRLAAQSGDTAVLSIRAGWEAVCLDRQTGDFPIQSNYLYPGTRRPLGVGAGATALLAALPPDEGDMLVELLAGKLEPFPRLSVAVVRDQVEHARRCGYAMVLNHIVDQMGGIAVAIRSPEGEALGAFSILALSERIESRIQQLAAFLHEAAHDTERVIAGEHDRSTSIRRAARRS